MVDGLSTLANQQCDREGRIQETNFDTAAKCPSTESACADDGLWLLANRGGGARTAAIGAGSG